MGCFVLFGIPFMVGSTEAGQGEGLSLETPLVLSFGREVGLPAPRDRRAESDGFLADDTTLVLQPPALTYRVRRARVNLSVGYQPELQLFVENRELSAWNHGAAFRLDYRPTRRLTLGAASVFLSTEDPARHLEQTTFLTGGGRYRQNALSFDLGYRWHPRTSLVVRVDSLMTRYEVAGGPAFSDPAAIGWTVSLSRALSARQSVGASYSLLQSMGRDAVSLPLGDVGAGTGPSHNLNLSYRDALGRGFSAELSAGLIAGDHVSYSFSGRVEKRLGPFSVATGYDRGLAFYGERRFPEASSGVVSASGLPPGAVFEAARLGIEGELASDFEFSLQAWAARRQSSLDTSSQTLWGRLRLLWRLADGLAAFVSGETYAWYDSSPSGGPLRRQRWVAGLEIGSPAQTPGVGFGAFRPEPSRRERRE